MPPGSPTSLRRYEGWAKYNRHHWLRDYPDFLTFFFGQVFTEPHSTKQIEDCIAWGLDTEPEVLIASVEGDDRGPFDSPALARSCVAASRVP